jgi:hypothetical protein
VPDQDHGNVNMRALQNMLIQETNDTIYLLPAWNPAWDVKFKVRATGQTSIEGEFKNGKLSRLTVVPEEKRKKVKVVTMNDER